MALKFAARSLSRVQKRFVADVTIREPFYPRPGHSPKYCTPDEAVTCIKSGDRVFLHSAAATPRVLVNAMAKYGKTGAIKNVEVAHIHIEGNAPHVSHEFQGVFRDNSFFIGKNVRKAVNEGDADYTPTFLKNVPALFRRGIVPLDVAFIQCSPPDKHGFMSLGCSVDVSRAALQCAKTVVVQVNRFMPRTHGDGVIHMSHVDYIVEHHEPLPEHKTEELGAEQRQIGEHIATKLVDNGATLQVGIGSIPDATLKLLHNHKNLGVHTEMFSDGVVDLVNSGVITNVNKVSHPGKIIAGFVVGTKKVFDFLDDNPFVQMLDISYVNAIENISRNPKVTAINAAIEVDLTGQVVSDSIGTTLFSGVGGQVDFIRGASNCPDGKPIIALTSTTHKGISRIVPFLKQGAGVVTSRADVRYIVTEYGIADLLGKNLRERAKALIAIAHPSHREALEKAAFERLKSL